MEWKTLRIKLQESQLTAVDFIRFVLTVQVSVTPPAALNTLPICTLELAGAAANNCLVGMSPAVLRPLIRPIGTILVSIAAPEGQHTHRIVALEGMPTASGFGAGGLIWAVRTVVVLVTNEGGGYTLAVGTFKLVGFALFGRWWGRRRRREELLWC